MLQLRESARESTSWGAASQAADPALAPIDSNGNLTQKVEGSDTWGYEWNAENQLTRVTKNSVEQARFSYDPLGRRVEKVAGGVTTTYTYDTDSVFREVRGGATLKYVQGPDIDEPLAVDDGSGLSYFHADALGSVVKMTNAAGSVSLSRQYDAWGNLDSGTAEPGYAFTGREWDPEIGLHYYRARYYDPKVGRFASQDPIGPLVEGVNLYAYVLNEPIGYRDPFGLSRSRIPQPPPELPCPVFPEPKICDEVYLGIYVIISGKCHVEVRGMDCKTVRIIVIPCEKLPIMYQHPSRGQKKWQEKPWPPRPWPPPFPDPPPSSPKCRPPCRS